MTYATSSGVMDGRVDVIMRHPQRRRCEVPDSPKPICRLPRRAICGYIESGNHQCRYSSTSAAIAGPPLKKLSFLPPITSFAKTVKASASRNNSRFLPCPAIPRRASPPSRVLVLAERRAAGCAASKGKGSPPWTGIAGRQRRAVAAGGRRRDFVVVEVEGGTQLQLKAGALRKHSAREMPPSTNNTFSTFRIHSHGRKFPACPQYPPSKRFWKRTFQ